MKKHSAGRPKLPSGKAKDTVLLIRLSTDEKRRLETQARRSGVKPSAWARTILLEESSKSV